MKYLKISTLDKGWYDKDELLLHAVFQILADFVEKERPEKIINWNADKKHHEAWKEIKKLYNWWKKVRPNRRSPLDDKKIAMPPLKWVKMTGSELHRKVNIDRKKYGAYYRAVRKQYEMEKKWRQEDQRNLHRLINVRYFLWT